MASSIVVLQPESGINTDGLYDKLDDNYEHEKPHPEVGTLVTDISSLSYVSRGFECRIRYDKVDSYLDRSGKNTYTKLDTALVRFTPDYVFFLSFDTRARVQRQVREILDLDTDEFEQVRFSSGLVMDVTEEDAEAIEEGYWDNPTENTTTASLYGDIDDSALAADFNREGIPTYAKFESEHFSGAEVGISANKNSLAFWGDRSNDEKVDYFFDIVEPLL